MDRLERPLVNLPLLLDPSSYVPDTVDLTDDALAREYWLSCFEEALDGVRGRRVAGAACRRSRPRGAWHRVGCPSPLRRTRGSRCFVGAWRQRARVSQTRQSLCQLLRVSRKHTVGPGVEQRWLGLWQPRGNSCIPVKSLKRPLGSALHPAWALRMSRATRPPAGSERRATRVWGRVSGDVGLSLGCGVVPLFPLPGEGHADGPVAGGSADASRRVRGPRPDPRPWQVVKRAVASQPGAADAAERAEKFRRKYWDKLQTLRHQPL